MGKVVVILWLTVVFIGIIAFFWQTAWVYALPTPVPPNYKTVNCGTYINLPASVKIDKKPIFLHFFNPACPCSRFNIAHFKTLVKQYGHSVDFAVVVMNHEEKYNAKWVQNKLGTNIPVLFDSSVATICGVYSTPQAVIINSDHKLYYRGNYNKSRYCTDAKSNYAQIALDSLIAGERKPRFDGQALVAYGCQLPLSKR